MEGSPNVSFIWSQALQDAADEVPANIGRSSMMHELIRALDLLELESSSSSSDMVGPGRASINQGEHVSLSTTMPHSPSHQRARLTAPDLSLGTAERLRRYHDAAYVDSLLKSEDDESGSSGNSDGEDAGSDGSAYRPRKRRKGRHGLEHDCPAFPALPTYATHLAAATQTACRRLLAGDSASICWDGGRHHALRNRASGFCYVADVVLGIMLLCKEGVTRPLKGPDSAEEPLDLARQPKARRPRIMYLDLDLHYGDGVAQAFLSPSHFPDPIPPGRKPPRPPQVLTLSIHHSSPIFFPPPTSHSHFPPPTTPHPFTLSIPLEAYPSRATYAAIWPSVERVRFAFDPDYVVLQLGADGLPGDPIGMYGGWAVDGEGGMVWCVRKVKGWGLPVVVLGGGGYDHPNTARAWARVTAELLGRDLAAETPIPHHAYFPDYAPAFTMDVPGTNRADENTPEHLAKIDDTCRVIASRIERIVKAHDG